MASVTTGWTWHLSKLASSVYSMWWRSFDSHDLRNPNPQMLRFSFFSVCFLINIFSRERESVQILVSIVFISFTSNYLGWWSPLINCKELKVFQKAPSIHIRSASYGTLFCWHNWSIVGGSTVVGKGWLVVWHVFPLSKDQMRAESVDSSIRRRRWKKWHLPWRFPGRNFLRNAKHM